ncbi:hypothetical protein HPB50_020041 [Hyalomma asiaticum]|uniref:Uncharacterized protein n=1 Tax=Hyalomma asiaticum TaxID=266040 RepID=A0ACB7SHB1_HYAAI|nr:hypothetical protein HPB50_020041 [Hyalomma asiaticum]
MPSIDLKANQSQEEGVQEGVEAAPATESPHRHSSVYSLRSFSTALDDYQECRSLSHLGVLMPVYLIPLLFFGLKLGGCLYCLLLPLLLWAFNSLPKPGAALVHLVTVPLMGLMEADQVAQQYMSLDVLLLALVLFLVVTVDRWSELAQYLAHGICERFGLRRSNLFVAACLFCFVCASLISGIVASTTLLYLLDRVLSTIFKENMDRPPELFRGGSQQGSQQDTSSARSVAASDQVLFDRLSQVVHAMKKPEGRKGRLARKQGAAGTTSDKVETAATTASGQETGQGSTAAPAVGDATEVQEEASAKRRFSLWRQMWSRKSSSASDGTFIPNYPSVPISIGPTVKPMFSTQEHIRAGTATLSGATRAEPGGGKRSASDDSAKPSDASTAKSKSSPAIPDILASTARAVQQPRDAGFVRVDIANEEEIINPTKPFAEASSARPARYPTERDPHSPQYLRRSVSMAPRSVDKQSPSLSQPHSPAIPSRQQIPPERRGTLSFLFGRCGSSSRRTSKGGEASGALSPKDISYRVFRQLGLMASRLSISHSLSPEAHLKHDADDSGLESRMRMSSSPSSRTERSEAGPKHQPVGSSIPVASGADQPLDRSAVTLADTATSLSLSRVVPSAQNRPAVSQLHVDRNNAESIGSTANVPATNATSTNLTDLPESNSASVTSLYRGKNSTWASHNSSSVHRSERVDHESSSGRHTRERRKRKSGAAVVQVDRDVEMDSEKKTEETAAEPREKLMYEGTSADSRKESDTGAYGTATLTQEDDTKRHKRKTLGIESVDRRADFRERSAMDTSTASKKRKLSRRKNKNSTASAFRRSSLRPKGTADIRELPQQSQGLIVPWSEPQDKGSGVDPSTEAQASHGIQDPQTMPSEKRSQPVCADDFDHATGAAVGETIQRSVDKETTDAHLRVADTNEAEEEAAAQNDSGKTQKAPKSKTKTKHESSSRSKARSERRRSKAAVGNGPNSLPAKERTKKNKQKAASTDSEAKENLVVRQLSTLDALTKGTEAQLEEPSQQPASEDSKTAEPRKRVSTDDIPLGRDSTPRKSEVPVGTEQPPLPSVSGAPKLGLRRKSETRAQAARRKQSVVSFGVDVKKPTLETEELPQLLPKAPMALAHLEEMTGKGSFKRRRSTILRTSSSIVVPRRVSSLDIGDQRYTLVSVRMDVHNAFLLGPSLMTVLGNICSFHEGGNKRALRVACHVEGVTAQHPVNTITWAIVTLPGAILALVTCTTVIWLLYVRPHEPSPLSPENLAVIRAAQERNAVRGKQKGVDFACATYLAILTLSYAPSLVLGLEQRIAVVGALTSMMLATSVLTSCIRAAFEFLRHVWQMLPWGIMLLLGATQVASKLLQKHGLLTEVFKLFSATFWEERSVLEVQAMLGLAASVMAETADKQAIVDIMAPMVMEIAELKQMYPAYYAIPVIVGASSNFIMPASVPLAILHDLSRVSFWRMLLLGLFAKIVVMSMVIVTVNVVERAGFLGVQTPAE